MNPFTLLLFILLGVLFCLVAATIVYHIAVAVNLHRGAKFMKDNPPGENNDGN